MITLTKKCFYTEIFDLFRSQKPPDIIHLVKMIHLIIGKQGSGKTLLLVMKAEEYYKMGYTVYSNVHLNFPYKQLNYNDIIECKLEKGIVILDEVHLLLPARRSMRKINQQICDGFLSMVRKKGLEVYGSTQTLRKVDVRFREEMDYFYICKKYALLKHSWSEVLHNHNLPIEIKILINVNITEMFSLSEIDYNFIGNRFFNKYDSNQIIKIKGLENVK